LVFEFAREDFDSLCAEKCRAVEEIAGAATAASAALAARDATVSPTFLSVRRRWRHHFLRPRLLTMVISTILLP